MISRSLTDFDALLVLGNRCFRATSECSCISCTGLVKDMGHVCAIEAELAEMQVVNRAPICGKNVCVVLVRGRKVLEVSDCVSVCLCVFATLVFPLSA